MSSAGSPPATGGPALPSQRDPVPGAKVECQSAKFQCQSPRLSASPPLGNRQPKQQSSTPPGTDLGEPLVALYGVGCAGDAALQVQQALLDTCRGTGRGTGITDHAATQITQRMPDLPGWCSCTTTKLGTGATWWRRAAAAEGHRDTTQVVPLAPACVYACLSLAAEQQPGLDRQQRWLPAQLQRVGACRRHSAEHHTLLGRATRRCCCAVNCKTRCQAAFLQLQLPVANTLQPLGTIPAVPACCPQTSWLAIGGVTRPAV